MNEACNRGKQSESEANVETPDRPNKKGLSLSLILLGRKTNTSTQVPVPGTMVINGVVI